MPLREQDQTLIEKYYLKRLTASEQSAFEERLGDADFKKELDLQGDLNLAFKAEGRAALKNQLQGFEKKIQQKETSTANVSSRFSIGRVLMIAASLAALIIAGYWWSNSAPSNDQLFAQYFEHYPNVVAPISKGQPDEDSKAAAFQAYELKKYPLALSLIAALSEQDETTAFYKGLCELNLNQAQKAIDHFKQVKNPSLSIYPASLWYQALALLKLDKKSEAVLLLETVSQDGATERLRNQAAELLKKIEH